MRFLLVAVALLLGGTAMAATPEGVVQQAVSAFAPNAKVEAAQESPIPGFYEAIVGGEFSRSAASRSLRSRFDSLRTSSPWSTRRSKA